MFFNLFKVLMLPINQEIFQYPFGCNPQYRLGSIGVDIFEVFLTDPIVALKPLFKGPGYHGASFS